jgi:cbb3-type cytochrome c oxidase subunit II
MDRLTSVLFFAGFSCFALAFALSCIYPWAITDAHHPEASIPELAKRVTGDFRRLKDEFPVEFAATYPRAAEALTEKELADVPAGDPRRAASEEAWQAAYAKALRDGRDIYVAEACWHCHSQFVRPVANEPERFGEVRSAQHYNTALDRPVMWGTRRVGPDLTNEGGLRSNDWHVAHLHDPRSTSPGSVMPAYTWYFHEGWQVRRRVDPAVAAREGLDPARSYAYPGLHATQADAETAKQAIAASLPQALDAEKDRLVVEKAVGPSGEALSLVAYLQWLGTWEPAEEPAR